MTHTEHPDSIALATFAEQPDSQHAVREHILHCAACRAKVDTLHSLQHQLGVLLPELAPAHRAVVNTADIAAYVDDRIEAASRSALAKQIKDDPASLKSALHYATHSAAMQQVLDSTHHYSTTSHTTNELWPKLKRWLTGPTPAWSMAAAASLLLGINLLVSNHNQQESSEKLQIASYQDDAKLYFPGDSAPGIGFFHNAQPQQAEKFSGMEFNLNTPNTLTVHWPEVENATYYTFNLRLISAGITQTLADTQVGAPELQITFEPQPGKRYEWQLSGQTQDGKFFQTQGGFVLHKG